MGGVVFDAMGTLLHLRAPVGATYARVARRHGVDLPESRLEEAFRRILAAAPPNVHPDAPPPQVAERERAWWRARVRETFRAADGTARFADFEAFFGELFAFYARPEAWRVTEGAGELLAALRGRGLRLAVLSNWDGRLRPLLDALGLGARVDAVVLPADAGAAKPDPRAFHAVLARLALSAQRVLYVGDDARDEVRQAGIAGLSAVDVDELATLADVLPLVERLEASIP